MGSSHSSHARELFEKIDAGHAGVLKLDDLLTVQNLPGVNHPITHSPMLLFRFDKSREGSIDYEAFQKLLRAVRQQPRPKRVPTAPTSSLAQTAAAAAAAAAASSESGAESGSGRASMDSADDARHIDLSAVASSDPSQEGVPMITTPQGQAFAGATERKPDAELVRQLTSNAREYMTEQLKDPDARRDFHTWLFRLADVNDRKELSREEVSLLLRALEADGIQSEALATAADADGAPQLSADERTARILEEYGSGATGLISQEQFMALADVITTLYEMRSADVKSERVGKYRLLRKIGEGSSGIVRVGLDTEGRRKAIKIVKKGTAADMSRLDVEIAAMTTLRHPHIVSLEAVLETAEHVFFVMELLPGGSLADHVAIAPFHNDVARHFFRQTLEGVSFCHQHNVRHRDLKLENLLLDSDGVTVKVCDFGHAGIASQGWDMFSTGLVGSIFHISPEQLSNQCYSGEKIDIWALGVLLYRMLTGKPPFYTENMQVMTERVLHADYTVPPEVSPLAADLLQKILQVDPEKRISIEEMLAHPWMTAPPQLETIPSLLRDVLVADCISVSRDVVIMVIHDVVRQNGTRCIHSAQDFNIMSCHDVPKDARFTIEIRKIPKEPPPARSKLSDSESADAPESPLTPVHIHVHPHGTRRPFSSAQPSAEDEEELLHILFQYTSGNGIAFRRDVQLIKTAVDKHLRAAAMVRAAPPSCIDTKLLLQSAAVLAQQFREAFEDSLQEEKATVLLLGKTGSGKSCVANKIFGAKLAEVGQGKPVTKHFTRHTLLGKPIVVYDSKGYEVNSAVEFADEISLFFESHRGTDNIHVVWYVVDGTSSRFEPFEANFCKTILNQVPVIILVNKADLCADGDIDALVKAIEAIGIPSVQAVIPTVSIDAVGPPPDRCTQCGSDDVSLLRKKHMWKCNECDFVDELPLSTDDDDGLKEVVEITRKIVPARVREAFVSGQKVSIQAKVDLSKGIITECFNECSFLDEKLALRKVLRMLARLCTVWDISALDPVANIPGLLPQPAQQQQQQQQQPPPQQASDPSPPLPAPQQPEAQVSPMPTPPPMPPVHVASPSLPQQPLARHPTHPDIDAAKASQGPLQPSTTRPTPRIAQPQPVQGQPLLPAASTTPLLLDDSDDSDSDIEVDDAAVIPVARQVLCMAMPMMQRGAVDEFSPQEAQTPSFHSTTSTVSAASAMGSGSSNAGDGFGWGWGFMERVLGVLGVSVGDVPQEAAAAAGIPSQSAPPQPTGSMHSPPLHAQRSGAITPATTASTSTTPSASVASLPVPKPNKSCLVTTAVAIAWTEALMRLHLLLVEQGIQLPREFHAREGSRGRHQRRLSMRRTLYDQMFTVVKRCVDHAFASFNEDRIAMLEQRLTEMPLPELLTSVLDALKVMNKSRTALPSPSPPQQQQQPVADPAPVQPQAPVPIAAPPPASFIAASAPSSSATATTSAVP